MTKRFRLLCGLAGLIYLVLAALLLPVLLRHREPTVLPSAPLLLWGFLAAMGGSAIWVAALARRVL